MKREASQKSENANILGRDKTWQSKKSDEWVLLKKKGTVTQSSSTVVVKGPSTIFWSEIG